MVHQTAFPVMGTEAHLLTVGGDPGDAIHHAAGAAHDAARRLLDDLERRWSRFRPDSEVSRLNAAAGRPVALAADTYALVAAAVEAWRLTAGRFDPTVLPALVAAGYDRSFERVEEGPGTPPPAVSVPGCAGIALVPDLHLVRLPAGTALDLGGIGKGHAADRTAAALLHAGAAGAMANLGGDVRVAGTPPDPGGWRVALEDPHRPGSDLAVVALADGAVATSSRLRRRWRRGGRDVHHVIDPATGQPAAGPVDAAVVVAAEAAWAEVLAKAALVAGPDDGAALVAAFGATGLLVLDDGATRLLAGMEEYLR